MGCLVIIEGKDMTQHIHAALYCRKLAIFLFIACRQEVNVENVVLLCRSHNLILRICVVECLVLLKKIDVTFI